MYIKQNNRWKRVKNVYRKESGSWKKSNNLLYKNSNWGIARNFYRLIEVKSAGYNDSNLSRYIKIDGTSIGGLGGRGWSIVVFPNGLESYSFSKRWDTYGSASEASDFISKLNSLNAGDLVIFMTYDEPSNRISTNSSFINEISKFGADTTIFDNMESRSSYILVAHKYGKKYFEQYKPRHSTENNYFSGIIYNEKPFFGEMSEIDWSNYNKTRISTSQRIEGSYGYENVKSATWTMTNIDSDTDWDKYPDAKAYFHRTSDMYNGQILVGNRVIFEMGNDHSDPPGGTWDRVGEIVEVDNGTQHYYVKKVYGSSPFNDGGDADDNGVWEVVDIVETNRGRNVTTTNYYLLN